MFIKVGHIVININRITTINLLPNHEVKIFFSDEHYRSLNFTTQERLEEFLKAIGQTTCLGL